MRRHTFLALFAGAGGASLGFHDAGWDCVGAFDFDAEACADHEYLTGYPAHVADLAEMQPHELRERMRSASRRGAQPHARGVSSWAKEPVLSESVDHPQHYNMGAIEVIDAIEDWDLGFHEGNVVKYVARAKHKGRELEDLEKARWYLDRCIQQLKEGT